MQTHLLNVTINWPRSVIFVCHSTLFALRTINVKSLNKLKEQCKAGSIVSLFTQHIPQCVHSFHWRQAAVCVVQNSPAGFSRSDLTTDWFPLRAHECRPQCEFTSVCHKTLSSWSLCTGFLRNKTGSTCRSHRNEGDVICFCQIVSPQVFCFYLFVSLLLL